MSKNRRDFLIAFSASGAFWGTLFGVAIALVLMMISVLSAVSGRAQFFETFANSGICFGLAFALFPFMVIGAINGLVCGLLTRHYDDPSGNALAYQKKILTTGLTFGTVVGAIPLIVTLIIGNEGFFLLTIVVLVLVVFLCGLSSLRIAQEHLGNLKTEEIGAHDSS